MDKIIVEVIPNLYLGECFAILPEITSQFHITHIFHVGFSISTRYKTQNIIYKHIELEDKTREVNELDNQGFQFINSITRLFENPNNKILICCTTGKNCSPSFIILYLITVGFSLNDAFVLINDKKEIQLNEEFYNYLHTIKVI
jgi:protein-tyrosine phosphatase